MKFMMLPKYGDTSLKHIRNPTAHFPDKVHWWIGLSVIKLQGPKKDLNLMASYRNTKFPTSIDHTDYC
jgi:hypothetical protein